MNPSQNCPICLDEIIVEYITNCGHIFCIDCIDCLHNFNKNNNCPICREPNTKNV